MKKRKGRGSVGASMDSLLDTMTNVVGILIIMLIVTQLQVSDAVERIKGFVEHISPDQLTASETESAELRELISEETKKWQELQIDEEKRKLSLWEQKSLINRIKEDLRQLADSNVDPDQIKKQNANRNLELAKLEADVDEKFKRIASLKAQLSTVSSGPDLDAKVVNLPNPRPAPTGAVAFDMLCYDGRVLPILESVLLRRCQRKVVQQRRTLTSPQGLLADKLIQAFTSAPIEDAYFRVKIEIDKSIPYVVLEPKKGAGEAAAVIRNEKSKFRGWLDQLNQDEQYVRFRVCTDSFEAYLAARAVTTEQAYLAGWLPYATTYRHRVRLDTGFKIQGKAVRLTCVGYKPPPPPAKKPPTAKPAKPARPALPTPAID